MSLDLTEDFFNQFEALRRENARLLAGQGAGGPRPPDPVIPAEDLATLREERDQWRERALKAEAELEVEETVTPPDSVISAEDLATLREELAQWRKRALKAEAKPSAEVLHSRLHLALDRIENLELDLLARDRRILALEGELYGGH